jgi:hypothetical protein
VVFVGIRPDHHRVLCIKDGDSLRLPSAELPLMRHPEELFHEIRERYISDELPYRQIFSAYARMPLSHHRGIIGIWAFAEIVDERCFMRCPYTGIWIPFRHMLTPEQPAEIHQALLALEHKHHLV